MVVDDVGTGAAMSARDTRWPTVTPEMIWVSLVLTVPTLTGTDVTFEPSTTVTRWLVPIVCTAEVGTVVTSTARWVTTATVASAPEKSPRSGESS